MSIELLIYVNQYFLAVTQNHFQGFQYQKKTECGTFVQSLSYDIISYISLVTFLNDAIQFDYIHLFFTLKKKCVENC